MPVTVAHVVFPSLPFKESYLFFVVNLLLQVVRVGPVEEPFGTTKPSFVYDLSAESAIFQQSLQHIWPTIKDIIF